MLDKASSRPIGLAGGNESPHQVSPAWALMLTTILSAPVCAQEGTNLSWDACGSSGSSAKAFACDTNFGSELLVGSFAPPSDLCLDGYAGVLDLQTSGGVLPDWWQFKNAGSCRQSALALSSDFSTGPAGCLDIWHQESFAGLYAYDVGLGGPNRARIVVVVSSLVPECKSFPGGVEVGGFKLVLSNDRTVGVGACQGCSESACIVFNSLTLYPANTSEFSLTAPLNRNFVTWQLGFPDCPGATPLQKKTWGAIKTLYH